MACRHSKIQSEAIDVLGTVPDETKRRRQPVRSSTEIEFAAVNITISYRWSNAGKSFQSLTPSKFYGPNFQENVGTVRKGGKKTIICKHMRKLRSKSSEIFKRGLLASNIVLRN